MKYIWQNYRADKNFFVEKKPLSPYLEVGFNDEKNCGVNPLPRFDEIFSPLAEKNFAEKFRPLENCLFHYLAKLDLSAGLHRVSVLEMQLDEEIRGNFFGERAAELYLSLTEDERRIFLVFLQRHEAAQGLETFFFDAASEFFPRSKFYFREWERKFLFCVPFPQTPHNEKLMALLIFFLFDMGVDYEIFWNEHFGIIGDDDTIKLDEFVIY